VLMPFKSDKISTISPITHFPKTHFPYLGVPQLAVAIKRSVLNGQGDLLPVNRILGPTGWGVRQTGKFRAGVDGVQGGEELPDEIEARQTSCSKTKHGRSQFKNSMVSAVQCRQYI
jgi:hypothetical protein